MPEVTHPIDGQVLLLAGAKASVTLEQLSALVARTQDYLGDHIHRYNRQYECAYDANAAKAYFVEPDHWQSIGTALGFNDRETAAVARTHAEQVRRFGKEQERQEEFEAALEIREAVVIS